MTKKQYTEEFKEQIIKECQKKARMLIPSCFPMVGHQGFEPGTP
jgi:hypothetical protein